MFIQAIEWLGGWVARMLDRLPPLAGRAFLVVVGLQIVFASGFRYLLSVGEYEYAMTLAGIMCGLAAYLGITKTTQNVKMKKLENDSR